MTLSDAHSAVFTTLTIRLTMGQADIPQHCLPQARKKEMVFLVQSKTSLYGHIHHTGNRPKHLRLLWPLRHHSRWGRPLLVLPVTTVATTWPWEIVPGRILVLEASSLVIIPTSTSGSFAGSFFCVFLSILLSTRFGQINLLSSSGPDANGSS